MGVCFSSFKKRHQKTSYENQNIILKFNINPSESKELQKPEPNSKNENFTFSPNPPSMTPDEKFQFSQNYPNKNSNENQNIIKDSILPTQQKNSLELKECPLMISNMK